EALRDIFPGLPAPDLTQPYWLREEPGVGMYKVSDPRNIGRPLSPAPFEIQYMFDINGQQLLLADVPHATVAGKLREMQIIAPVSLAFGSQVRLFSPGTAKTVDVEITAHHENAKGSLKLVIPAGWQASPPSQDFALAKI